MGPQATPDHGGPALALQVLEDLARDAPGAVLLWRGPQLDGADIDGLVLPGREADVSRALRGLRLSPAPQNGGQVLWRLFADGAIPVVLDLWAAWAWPPELPPLDRVLARSSPGPAGLPVASAEDRLLTFAAEAVAGRPLAKLAPKVEALRGHVDGLGALAAEEGVTGLARLVGRPLPPDGVLPLARAVRAGLGSRRGRAALARRLGRPYPLIPPGRPGAPAGRLVALSGMDGSGKSSAALELVARLEAGGRPALAAWSRVGTDWHLLDPVARPLRALLRRPEGGMADPTGEGVGTAGTARRRDPLRWAWTLVVVLTYAATCRRLAAARARGFDVVCDRWLADALIDVEVRYGRHRAAEWLLRRLMPRPEHAVLLVLDAKTAAARKPGDQTEAALRLMEARYEDVGRRLGLPRVDARRAPAEIHRELAAIVGLADAA